MRTNKIPNDLKKAFLFPDTDTQYSGRIRSLALKSELNKSEVLTLNNLIVKSGDDIHLNVRIRAHKWVSSVLNSEEDTAKIVTNYSTLSDEQKKSIDSAIESILSSKERCQDRKRSLTLTDLVIDDEAKEYSTLSTNKLITVSGKALTYSEVAQLSDGGWESVLAGTFTDKLADTSWEISLHTQHQTRYIPLANTKAGTLTIIDEYEALRFIAYLDPSEKSHSEFITAIRTGALQHCSIGYTCIESKMEYINNKMVEVVTKGRLNEISIVTNPVFHNTNVTVG